MTFLRTLIESKPVGVNHISMEARISENGIIKEVSFTFKFSIPTQRMSFRNRF